MPDDDAREPSSYAAALGERLRRVRVQQQLSLHDVERISEGRYKASVLGAYERGERAVSVARLRAIADFYRVPLSELIPRPPGTESGRSTRSGLSIDLSRLETRDLPEGEPVGRFVQAVKVRRGDYNGRVITIRHDDVRALAAILACTPAELQERLRRAGVAREPASAGRAGRTR